MSEHDPLPEEDAERIARDESISDGEAHRMLMALLISQLGFIASVMISIDNRLEAMETLPDGESVH